MIKSNFDENEQEKVILTVEIQCVTPPLDYQLEKLRSFFLSEYEADDIDFIIKKTPGVIGGFRIFVNDESYDWSTLGRIRQLRKSFLSLAKGHDPAHIISLLREGIENFELHAGHEPVGFVSTVGDGIATINGLHKVRYGDVVLFDSGVKGMVQDIRSDGTNGIVLFGSDSEIYEGSRVISTNRTAGIPISPKILGRIVDPLGLPIDGGPDIAAKEYYPIERPAPGIIQRKSVNRPMETGILAIDSMFPIGKGQRQLIIGDRQTGKTTIATDTIINQRDKNVICIYVAIGQKASSVAKVVSTLKKYDAMDYTVVVSSPASDPASLQYLAPYSGCAIAEYFMYHGRDVLIVYDDLSKHAVAYRTLSLLLERSPGREAYPGDVFYLHSRLLERAAQLSDSLGGGSITALPIVETQSGDVSAYIPTNIISITDGQLFLESNLFFSGQRPAIHVGLSVSRVGGSAQTNVMKKSVGSIRLDLAQYREMQTFSQFGGDLDSGTLKQLNYGAGLMQLLRQPGNSPMTLPHQVITLICAREKIFTDIPLKKIKSVQQDLLSFFDHHYSAICHKILLDPSYSPALHQEIKDAALDYLNHHML